MGVFLGGIPLLSNVRTLLSKHFSQHIMLYFTVILAFSIGVATGVFSVKALSEVQKEQLIDYMVTSFQAVLTRGQINYTQILVSSIFSNLKLTLLIWFFSVIIFVFPLIFFVVGAKGFILGFTVGFLIENMGYKGALFATVGVLPQSLINIPIVVVLAVVSINYSVARLKNRKVKRHSKNESSKMLVAYSFLVLLLFALMLLGSLIETYLSPILLKGISGYIFK